MLLLISRAQRILTFDFPLNFFKTQMSRLCFKSYFDTPLPDNHQAVITTGAYLLELEFNRLLEASTAFLSLMVDSEGKFLKEYFEFCGCVGTQLKLSYFC